MVLTRQRQPLTARGPLRATLFLLMLSIVASAMVVLPSFNIGVTSTGSHFTGAYILVRRIVYAGVDQHTLAAAKMSLTD